MTAITKHNPQLPSLRAAEEAEKAVEQWKVKKLINTLEQARG